MSYFVHSFSGVSVNDIATAKEFYVNILGLEVADEYMGLQLKLPGGADLFIYEKPNHEPATYTMLNLVVEDINAAIDELVAKGVLFEVYTTLPAPQDERGVLRGKDVNQGPNIAWFKDPAGNTLSLIEN